MGGSDTLSEGQRQLVRRAATLAVEAEKMEAEAVRTGEMDIQAFCNLSAAQSRLFHRLGLRRVARDVGPRDIREYAAAKAKAKPA